MRHVRAPLSDALGRVKLSRKGLGTDITHGTEYYTPVVTLLARTLGTRRQDLVYAVCPLLGCPFWYYERAIPQAFATQLLARMEREAKPAVLWEILDFLQAVGKWDLKSIIEFVRHVEREMAARPEITTRLQAMADEAVERHDREGITPNAPGMVEGLVIPVPEPKGRVH